MTLLFDEQQLGRFHQLYNQAPCLYTPHVPHAPLSMMLPGPAMPPVQRLLFLEQDEQRMYVEGRLGFSGFYRHERNMDMNRTKS